jgi:acetyl esterase/lipase
MTSIGPAMLAAAASLLAAGAHAAPVKAEVAAQVVSVDRFPALRATFPRGVTGHPGVVYATLPGYRPLTLDIYTPAKSGGPKPLVIYIHGGGWVGGSERNAAAFQTFPDVLADLASRGYVVASLTYRLSGEARFPAAAQDVDAAIRWLKGHAVDYGIDKTRVAVWGGSAGGQLAALAAADCSPGDTKGESDCVQAAAIWYGVFDFSTLPPGPAPGAAAPGGPAGYLGCAPQACPDVAARASAVTFIDHKTPPFLLIHGTADRTVPVTQSREMIERLRAGGVKADFIELPGIDHSFMGKTPEETRAAHLKALQATFDFFDSTVGKR